MKILIDEIKFSAAADPAEKEKVRVYLLFFLEILRFCILLTLRTKEVLSIKDILNLNLLEKLDLDKFYQYFKELVEVEGKIEDLLLIFHDSALLAFENGSQEYLFVKEVSEKIEERFEKSKK